MPLPTTTLTQLTAPTAGAVGILQLHGPDASTLLQQLTGRTHWPTGRLSLVHLADIDTGLAVLWRQGEQGWAQLLPHGGPRVMRDLVTKLLELGAVYESQPQAHLLYPEARSTLEADMLLALSQCPAGGAVDLLLMQPMLWCDWLRESEKNQSLITSPAIGNILARSKVLEHYRTPPTVVVMGVPNVGKSTLTNRVLGRTASLVADLPGTTRDWVAGLVELQGIAFRWLDTPGLRHSNDPIEQQAIDLAKQVIAQADVIVLLRDHEHDWPEVDTTLMKPGTPVLKACNKIDQHLASPLPENVLGLSAQTGAGLDTLSECIVRALGLPASHDELWAFSPTLRQGLRESNWPRLREYVGDRQPPTTYF